MSPRRMVRRAGRIPRRRLTWAEFDSAVLVGTTGHASNTDLLQPFVVNGGEVNGATIMRTHIRLWPTTAVAAGDSYKLGLMVAGQNQVGTGSYATGAVPNFDNPVDVPYIDWMLVDRADARPTYGRYSSTNEIFYDLRSKRRILDVENTYMISLCATAVGASLSLQVFARVLLALP